VAIVITAPNDWEKREAPGIFLAGGISQCPDWQERAIEALHNQDIVLLNPRRPGMTFRDFDHTVGRQQITWEYTNLRKADAVCFWFPQYTECPITLYELGAWARDEKPIIVGTEGHWYSRRFDVVEQLRLARPGLVVTKTFELFLKDLTHLAKHLPRRVERPFIREMKEGPW
jgi:hypothetical protein